MEFGGETRMSEETGAEADPAAETRSSAEPGGHAARARLPAPLQTRDRDRYEIVSEHGRGGIGRVYRAHDKELGRDVAVKELLQGGREREVRFLREALITARLEHPGIVPVHEAGRWPDGTPFYAMKLVAGRALSELIIEQSSLEQRLALIPHVIAVADAVAYAHHRRIVHRDLKPSNVIVGQFGETVVIDWGLAKRLDAEERLDEAEDAQPCDRSNELTATGSVLGTPAFMAPEQACGDAIDERTDVYALGAILANVISGVPGKVLPARSRKDARDLAAIAGRAMATDPRERYASALAFATDLRAYLARRPVEARRYHLVDRLALFAARHRTATLAVTTLLAALIPFLVAAVIKVSRQRQGEAEARGVAERAERDTAAARDALLLETAALQLERDPTRAYETLRVYHGQDFALHQRLTAEAIGRGVATSISKSHNDAVLAVHVLSNGTVVTVGRDGVLAVQGPAGFVELAADVYIDVNVDAHRFGDFAQQKDVAVYWAREEGGSPARLYFVDLAGGWMRPLPISPHIDGDRVALSADGERLAIQQGQTLLVVTSAGERLLELPFDDLTSLAWSGRNLVAASAVGVELINERGDRTRLSRRRASGAVKAGAVGAVWREDDRTLTAWLGDGGVRRFNHCSDSVAGYELASVASTIVLYCGSGVATILDAKTGEVLASTELRQVRTMTMSEDGRYVLVGQDDGTAHLFDVESEWERKYVGHSAEVVAVAVRHSPPVIATADADGFIRQWSFSSVTPRRLFREPTSDVQLAFSRDSRLLVAGGSTSASIAFDLAARRIMVRDEGGSDAALGYGPSVSGQPSAESDPVVSEFGALVHSWTPDYLEGVVFPAVPLRVEPLPGTDTMLAALENGEVWTLALAEDPIRRWQLDGTIVGMRASQRGNNAVIGTSDGRLVVLDTSSWAEVYSTQLDGSIRDVAISDDGTKVAASAAPAGLIVADVAERRELVTFDRLRGRRVDFSADGEHLVVGAGDGTAWFLDLRALAWTIVPVSLAELRTALYSPDGAVVAFADRRGAVFLLDAGSIAASPFGQRRDDGTYVVGPTTASPPAIAH
jgi:eukaryotic-like serine/threonine-protein kinase